MLGHQVTPKLTCRETDGEYFVFEAVTPPGVGVPLHVHRHEDEFFRVLDGEFEFQLDQQIQRVTPGAMVTFPKNIPHAFRNVGTKPGRTLWTVMPGANFEKFFGAKVGEYRRVILRHVTQDGALGAIESRKAVQVKSHNWRFELAAAGGRAYPDSKTGRPIGVFLRLPTSVILYDVLLPGDPGYSDAARILKVKWLGPANRVRRITMSAAELRSEWPLAGFWKVDEDPH